jgi:hypothetical protein
MQFRKKPVVIEARQIDTLDLDGLIDILKWSGATPRSNDEVEAGVESGPVMTIHTLEGDHAAMDGDWIIKGVKGEFYPCKPEIFEATYEPVDDQ